MKPIETKLVECEKCKRYMGKLEINLKDELNNMCIECFRDETDQDGKWFER